MNTFNPTPTSTRAACFAVALTAVLAVLGAIDGLAGHYGDLAQTQQAAQRTVVVAQR